MLLKEKGPAGEAACAAVADSGAAGYAVSIVCRKPGLAESLSAELERCGLEEVSVEKRGRLPMDLGPEGPSALFIEAGASAAKGGSLILAAREEEYRGVIVAVAERADLDGASRAVSEGADHVLLVPVEGIEAEILVKMIQTVRKTPLSTVKVLEEFFEPVDQGVILLDADQSPVFANRTARSILASDRPESIVPILERSCPDSIFDKAMAEGSTITYVDATLPGREARRLLGLEICYLESIAEFPVYFILIHDFTKWKRLDELKSRFATSLSHRMRTPLTSIRNAVKLLCDADAPPAGEEREKLLDIGWRNVEKLIADLDELQKVFMIESEEMRICRTLVRVKAETRSQLDELEAAGRIRGHKTSMPDLTIFTGSGGLRDFIASAVDAYEKWLGDKPFIECSSAIKEEYNSAGELDRRFKIYIRRRTNSSPRSTRESLKDFLSLREAHRGLVLQRLATALDGQLDIGSGNTIGLVLPLEPAFDREKDLVHPLHMMIERAGISSSEFSLVDLSMHGKVPDEARFAGMLERCLYHEIDPDGIVANGERPATYSLFMINSGPDEVSQIMASINERFQDTCRKSGEEVMPSLRWEIKYSHVPGDAGSTLDSILAG